MVFKNDKDDTIEQNNYKKSEIDMYFCDFTLSSAVCPKIRDKEGVIIDKFTKLVIVFDVLFT